MNSREVTEKMFYIERRLGLFGDLSIGPFWWNAVRYEVFDEVVSQVLGVAPTPSPIDSFARRLLRFLVRLALSIRLWICVATRRFDVLVFRAPRQLRNGRRGDLTLDGLVELCPGRKLIIDTFPHYYHRSTRAPHVFTLSQSQSQVLVSLLNELRAHFGECIDRDRLEKLVSETFAAHLLAESYYQELLRRTGAHTILMTQNGIEKGMFSAARKMGVTVVEVQHGLIGHDHPAYSYPKDIDYSEIPSFPEYFLTLSPYWLDACNYPAVHAVSIGSDSFVCAPLPLSDAEGDILIISGDGYHEKLSEWLVLLAPLLPGRRILYKLHPNQQRLESRIREDFSALQNVLVVSASIPLQQVLDTVSDVILIKSTVAYEALQAGRKVHILQELNYQWHQDLFSLPGVIVSGNVTALVDELKAPLQVGNPPRFFEPLDRLTAQLLLADLIQAGRSSRARAGH